MHDQDVQEKVRTLVQQLFSNTLYGKVAWTDTADADAFRATMQGGMVRVQKQTHLDEEGHEEISYSLTLLDRKGRELEEYYPWQGVEEDRVEKDNLAALWNLARRSSRATVDILDRLLKETASEER